MACCSARPRRLLAERLFKCRRCLLDFEREMLLAFRQLAGKPQAAKRRAQREWRLSTTETLGTEVA